MSLALRTVSDFFTSALISSQKQINHIDKEAYKNGGTIGTHVGLLCEAISTKLDTRTCFKLEQLLNELTTISAQTQQQLTSPVLEYIHLLLQNLDINYHNKRQSFETNNFHEETHKFINALSCSIQALEEFDILATKSGLYNENLEYCLETKLVTSCDKNIRNEEYKQYILDIRRSFLSGLMVICEAWHGRDSLHSDVLDVMAKMVEEIETIATNKSCRNEDAPSHAVNQVFATFLRATLEGMKVAHSFDGVRKHATSDSSDDVIEILD